MCSSDLFNEQTGLVEKFVDGTYLQYPMTLAWAVTAHKAQGKTLGSVNIINKTRSFASGQTYVALSRTGSIKDIHLKYPLLDWHFKQDEDLLRLMEHLKPRKMKSSDKPESLENS